MHKYIIKTNTQHIQMQTDAHRHADTCQSRMSHHALERLCAISTKVSKNHPNFDQSKKYIYFQPIYLIFGMCVIQYLDIVLSKIQMICTSINGFIAVNLVPVFFGTPGISYFYYLKSLA